MKKLLLIILIGVFIMLKPINAIIANSIGNIIQRGSVVTGIIATDNGDGSYDVYISESDKARPNVRTLSANPDIAVDDKVRILYKDGCPELPIIYPPSTALITGNWVSPTGHIDLGGPRGWWNETRMYDEDLGTYSAYNVSDRTWSNFIRLTHAAMRCNAIRLYITYILGRNDIIDIDAFYGGIWNHVFEGDYDHLCDGFGNPLEWYEVAIGSIEVITEFRIRVFNSHWFNAYGCGIYEVDFFEVD